MRGVLIPLMVALVALSAVPLVAGDSPKGKAARDDEKKGEKKSAGEKGEQRGERKGSDEGKKPKLPKAVAEAVKSVFPGMKMVKSEEEDEDGQVVYAVTLRGKHGTLEAKLTPKGRVVEVELEGDDEDEGQPGQKGGKEKEKAKGKEKEKDDEKGEKKKQKGEDDEKGEKKGEKNKQNGDDEEKGEKKQKGEKKGEGEKGQKTGGASPGEWTSDFSADKDALTHTGKNPYFVLEPGYQLVFEGGDEKVVKTVLDETKVVDGVECRVVEERETKKGKLVEVSRNYFAISKRTNSVYYFGEDVDEYADDKVVGHKGSWLAGKDGATFGLMMPAVPLLRGRFYQEVAPKVAEDRAEIVAVDVAVKTPAGEFKKCVKMEETTPLEPDTKEYKVYAPGVGCVQDGDLKLVKYGKVERPKN